LHDRSLVPADDATRLAVPDSRGILDTLPRAGVVRGPHGGMPSAAACGIGSGMWPCRRRPSRTPSIRFSQRIVQKPHHATFTKCS